MLNIVIFGAPGSGKGTQSELIIKKYGLRHISTGDVLRQEIIDGTSLGALAEEYISKGLLVPDRLVIDMLADILARHPEVKGFLFDGFPRTLPQGEALDDLLRAKNTAVAAVLSLDVEEELLVKRLLKRGEVSGRNDDNVETITRRLEVYKTQTEPLKEYYKKTGKLFNIRGNNTIEDVFERIVETIDRLTL